MYRELSRYQMDGWMLGKRWPMRSPETHPHARLKIVLIPGKNSIRFDLPVSRVNRWAKRNRFFIWVFVLVQHGLKMAIAHSRPSYDAFGSLHFYSDEYHIRQCFVGVAALQTSLFTTDKSNVSKRINRRENGKIYLIQSVKFYFIIISCPPCWLRYLNFFLL